MLEDLFDVVGLAIEETTFRYPDGGNCFVEICPQDQGQLLSYHLKLENGYVATRASLAEDSSFSLDPEDKYR